MKLRDGIALEGERLYSTGEDSNGMWACFVPLDWNPWEKYQPSRSVRIEKSDILPPERPSWVGPYWEPKPLEYPFRSPEELKEWADRIARRWKICREKMGENVKWDDPGFQELYNSIP